MHSSALFGHLEEVMEGKLSQKNFAASIPTFISC